MPAYRLYRLDGAGKIVTADWIDADDDAAALAAAREGSTAPGFELWERGRLVAKHPEGAKD